MSLYSKIERRMWGDRRFRSLSSPPANAQTIWVYLLSGPHSTALPGLFELSAEAIAGKHRWPVAETRAALEEILEAGMALEDRDAGVIVLPNALQANAPQSLNVVKAWGPVLVELPESDLVDGWIAAARDYLEARGPSWLAAFEEGYAEAMGEGIPDAIPDAPRKACRIQEQEQEQEEEGEARASARPTPGSPAAAKKKRRGRGAAAGGGHRGATGEAEARLVVAPWCRVWEEHHGQAYPPGQFDVASACRLKKSLTEEQLELLEPAMRLYLGSEKRGRQSLDRFCQAAGRLISEAAEKRAEAARAKQRAAEEAERREEGAEALAPLRELPAFLREIGQRVLAGANEAEEIERCPG